MCYFIFGLGEIMNNEFEKLMADIKTCCLCESKFGYIPRPVIWGSNKAKIVQISQAPSLGVHESLKPFDDASGKRLRNWYDITEEDFYNFDNFYITAMAHCYPGKNKNGGDNLPPQKCFKTWVKRELEYIDNDIYILIGAFAAKTFFPEEEFEKLVFKDNYYNGKLTFVLPHPSPLNNRWLKSHPQFENERILQIKDKIKELLK